ncbi:MAG: UDP-N-acetylmuramoyl-L-alanine--D-glutamate ligase [Candidatus Saganbacteria bacterium]|nr:UDP-N-acetylmuramoyl-L-alanine--D-glutamate ligase [Candidatus Saganbacteria bacterium]
MIKEQRIAVLGLAKSGLAAAERLKGLGKQVFLSETKPRSQISPASLKALAELGLEAEFGGHSQKVLLADLIVISPGIPLDIPIVRQAAAKGIPVISEIELAYRLLTKPIIAITGTNGKTTTTTLIGELLKAAGKKVAVAGNIGEPLVLVDDTALDYIIAEISSYQLETIVDFRPWISVILNIQPDHLVRHGDMSGYIKAKARIFINQTGDDYLVFNEDDPAVKKMAKTASCRLKGFSKDCFKIITLDPKEIKIPGRHNLENSLAAATVADICGVDKQVVAEVLKNFPGVEHRIEMVAEGNGVTYYNDSKATNPDSTLVALETFAGRGIVLILGGKDKGTELATLSKKIKEFVKFVVLIGEATDRFAAALKQAGYSAVSRVNDLEAAVRTAGAKAVKGDIVLLSPACASFDMFANFEERGRVFKQIVKEVVGGSEPSPSFK